MCPLLPASLRVSLLALVAFASGACAANGRTPWEALEPWSDEWILAHAKSYLEDREARREAMEASLTNPANLYGQTRLGAYGLPTGGWDALPEWNPRSEPLSDAHVAALTAGERPPRPTERVWDGETPASWEAWAALGQRVFFEVPLRDEALWEPIVVDEAQATAVGLARDGDTWPGLVWMADLEGGASIGITCALCHVGARDGVLEVGRARRTLDYGRAQLASAERRGIPLDSTTRARFESWGPGRADVLEDVADTPIAIPDLWGLRDHRFLTQAGTLTHEDPRALAIRQETQYIQANRGRTRPPRALAFALAVYLYDLRAPRPRSFVDREAAGRGEAVFRSECQHCHALPNGSGALVATSQVGTDPELGEGNARGTNAYRPAPLLGVADAAPYLHHGVVPTLEALLSAVRAEPGHRFGVDLEPPAKSDLLVWLRGL